MNSQNTIRKYVFNVDYQIIYNEYKSYLLTQNLKEGTIDWRLKHIKGLLHYLYQEKILFEKLEKKHIYKYMLSISNNSFRTREHRAICIKLFLNWLYNRKIINFTGGDIFSKIKSYKRNGKPFSSFNDEEITKLINSVDINTKGGKRDLAVLLLFSYYGIRTNDIRYLKFNSLKFNENKISIIQTKNNYINNFLMIDVVKYALLDYLMNERFNVNSEYVFINKDGKPYSDSKFYSIVEHYFKKAGINIIGKNHGPHSLRHSLGFSLLKMKSNIYQISSILGHSSSETTEIYTKASMEQLKKLSLEVPIWKI